MTYDARFSPLVAALRVEETGGSGPKEIASDSAGVGNLRTVEVAAAVGSLAWLRPRVPCAA